MVSVAQGFHWLHRPKTLNEIARVLKPGGILGLVWYRRHDLTKPHEIFIEGLTHAYNPNYDPTFMDLDYIEMLENHGNFRDIGKRNFFETKAFDLETYIRWQKSKSFIGDAMEPEVLDEFLKKVKSGIVRYFPNGIIRQDLEYELIYARRM
jgi:ubiquinone/menaquinone biosynthesis C-methylase UbiE